MTKPETPNDPAILVAQLQAELNTMVIEILASIAALSDTIVEAGLTTGTELLAKKDKAVSLIKAQEVSGD